MALFTRGKQGGRIAANAQGDLQGARRAATIGELLLVALIVAACAYAVWYYRAAGDRVRTAGVAEVPSQLIPLPPPAPAPEPSPGAAPSEEPSPAPSGSPPAPAPIEPATTAPV